jgi:hypothetical protein
MNAELHAGRRISRVVALSNPREEQIIAKFRANTAGLPPDARCGLERAVLNDAPRGQALVQLALAAMVGHRAR